MTTKHTPGPWTLLEAARSNLIHIETDEGCSDGQGIAICSLPKSKIGDAQLIAAAPDLLNSLIKIRDKFQRLRNEAQSIRDAVFLDAAIAVVNSNSDDAITKARGEA